MEVVIDASVIVHWFGPESGAHAGHARAVRTRYRAGELRVAVPGVLFLEILNVAARRWNWPEEDLLELVGSLASANFEVQEPPLAAVARWAARGLTAYDACYVALAEERQARVITDDRQILQVAPSFAIAIEQAS